MVLGARNQALLLHPFEHEIPGQCGALLVVPRRQELRALKQAGKHRGLAAVELLRAPPEISPRRRFHAIKPAAKIDAVEIELHDLALGKILLYSERQKHFNKLALVGALPQLERVARELLRHGTRSLRDFSTTVIRNRRTHYAHIVHSVMLEKFVVLGRNNGLHHHRRNFVQ